MICCMEKSQKFQLDRMIFILLSKLFLRCSNSGQPHDLTDSNSSPFLLFQIRYNYEEVDAFQILKYFFDKIVDLYESHTKIEKLRNFIKLQICVLDIFYNYIVKQMGCPIFSVPSEEKYRQKKHQISMCQLNDSLGASPQKQSYSTSQIQIAFKLKQTRKSGHGRQSDPTSIRTSLISYHQQFNGKVVMLGEQQTESQLNQKPKEGYILFGNYLFQYDLQKSLGSGGYGQVYKGYHRSKQQTIAIKLMQPKPGQFRLCLQEALRQKLLDSQHIVKIKAIGTLQISKDKKKFAIGMEQMDKGQLKVIQEGYSAKEALQIIKKILRSYSQLYKKGIVHRDLKPKNILTNSKGQIKLSDFGSSREKTDPKQKTTPSSKQYASPEQIKNWDHTDKCDVYAIGCIFFELIVGKTPTRAKITKGYNKIKEKEMRKKLQNALQNKGQNPQTSEKIINFIEGCLKEKQIFEKEVNGKMVEDPKQSRFSWEDVYLHPIFSGQKFEDIARSVGGHDILLTINTLGKTNKVNVIKILQQKQKQRMNKKQSSSLTRKQLDQLLRKYKIYIPSKDIERLDKMFGGKQDTFIIGQLIKQLGKPEQIYQFKPQQTSIFLKMFKTLYTQESAKKYIQKFQNKQYLNIEHLLFEEYQLTGFPPLPKMDKLKSITIRFSCILVLNVKLNAPNLKILKLKSNQTEKIMTIRGCPSLQKLDLSGNRLRQIEGLQLLGQLKFLDVSLNRLTNISNIGHLKHLTKLSLFSNRITAIEGLQGCTSLTKILLNDNFIKNLDGLLMIEAENINFIYLYGNRITKDSKNIGHLEYFKENRPNTKIYLSVKQCKLNEDFQEVYQTRIIEEGKYWIVSYKQLSCCIGIDGQFMMMSPQDISFDKSNIWTIKPFKNDKQQELEEHCIFSHQNQIVSHYYGACWLNKIVKEYQQQQPIEQQLKKGSNKEEEPQRNSILDEQCQQKMKALMEESSYRWIFERRGENRKKCPYFSISNAYWKERIALIDGKIKTISQECLDQSDCWYIVPTVFKRPRNQ